MKMLSQQFLWSLSLVCWVGRTWQGDDLMQISGTQIKGHGHEYTSLENLLYAILSVIVRQI